MVRKKEQYAEALQLRKRGFTYSEIATMLSVSKSSVSNWLSRETWSLKVREDNTKRAARDNGKRISLLNKARGNQFTKLYAEAERSAVTEYRHYKLNPLFMAGLMLYFGQGHHTESHIIRFTGTNMEAHRIFIRFAQEFLGVPREKIRFLLLLYPPMSPSHCLLAWEKAIKIPRVQFHKPQTLQQTSAKPALHSGVGNTIIGGTVLKRKLGIWLTCASKEL